MSIPECVLWALAALLVMALAFTAWPAKAHEMGVDAQGRSVFYSVRCCSERDCSPIPNGTVRIGEDGYLVPARGEWHLIPWGDKRLQYTPPDLSPEFDYHVCLYPDSKWARDKGKVIRCLYRPFQGG